MSESYQKLISILKEMFQLDQSDLDFGIYRIMNYKRNEIEKFLNEDLLPQVRTELEKYISVEQKSIEKELKELTKRLEEDGVPFESSTKYVALKSKLDNGLSVTSVENEVYSHLANFFRRYYSNGDFISLRRYKKDVYALPYEGEEVKLHWANADQYYIKTAEYFRDYRFKTPDGKAIHFKLVNAETEKDNNKTQKGKERRFLLYREEPLAEENGELIIKFEYVINEKKQKDLTAEAIEIISEIINNNKNFIHYRTLLNPTEDNPRKTLLEKYINDYTSRNTFDYFIHKDLGNFLRRELDFYIKNEVLFLDDIDIEDNLKIEQYLTKIRVIKKIGYKIIAFLEQIENFQKKLWLKKKFIVETNYCITLDRIDESFYPEIISNSSQIQEWIEMYSIDSIEGDLTTVGYSNPLTIEFLKQNKNLVLDTKHFSNEFKERLIASIDDLDEKTNGLLIHSENFQALNLLLGKYKQKVKFIYIDPPYNTGDDGFLYKDSYQHSSWLSLLYDRIVKGITLLKTDGVHFVSIGDEEEGNLRVLLDSIFPGKTIPYIWKSRTKPTNAGDAKYRPQVVGEFVFQNQLTSNLKYYPLVSGQVRKYPHVDEGGKYRITSILTSNLGRYRRETMRFEIAGYTPPEDKRWKAGEEEIKKLYETNRIGFNDEGEPYRKHYEGDEEEQHIPLWTFLPEDITGTAESGKTELSSIIGSDHGLDSVKPKELITVFLNALVDKDEIILDYFAGSGTTAHAVINLNREDGGNRKYILVEMGEYFDSITKPRIQKVIYSKDWKDGKPVSREGSSHIFKYIRLESYEDTLNNLEINLTQEQLSLLEQNPELREQYMLSYMLNNETENSMSLLNIDMFKNPFEYKMKIAKGLETQVTTIDLVETFNYLLGLEVIRNEKRERYNAVEDKDSTVPGAVKLNSAKDGEYVFKEIEGRTLDGEKVLVIWRTLSDDIVKDNAVLDAYFLKKKYSTRDFEFDRIYVNGDNNLQNLRMEDERWKVVLIEEEFKKLMFDVQDI